MTPFSVVGQVAHGLTRRRESFVRIVMGNMARID
jgi:hypothetical protein